MNPLLKVYKNQQGAVAILVAIVLPILLGLAALAIDIGYLFVQRNQMQAAADAAALVAANARQHGESIAEAQASAWEAARANGFERGQANTTVTVSIPPGGASSFAADDHYVRVTVAQPNATFLAWVVGVLQTSNTVQATAGPATTGGPCLLTLGTSGSGALSVVGNAAVGTKNCGIFVNSNSPSAFQATGNVTVTATPIQVAGGYTKTGNVTLSPVTTNAAVQADPFSSLPMPAFTACTFNHYSVSGNGSVVLQPGTYCGGITLSGNHTVTLNAGLYVIYGGGLNLSGNISPISGTGVTIYNSGNASTYPYGGLDLSGNISLNLIAPTSGTYSGMLFMQNPSNSKTATVVGNSSAVLAGNLYFPGNTLNLTGNSGTQIPMGSVVAKQVSIFGNANFNMTNSYGNNAGGTARSGLYE